MSHFGVRCWICCHGRFPEFAPSMASSHPRFFGGTLSSSKATVVFTTTHSPWPNCSTTNPMEVITYYILYYIQYITIYIYIYGITIQKSILGKLYIVLYIYILIVIDTNNRYIYIYYYTTNQYYYYRQPIYVYIYNNHPLFAHLVIIELHLFDDLPISWRHSKLRTHPTAAHGDHAVDGHLGLEKLPVKWMETINQWLGFFLGKSKPETIDFPSKYRVFRLKFALTPIYLKNLWV